jgi:hypothetical protein
MDFAGIQHELAALVTRRPDVPVRAGRKEAA